VSWAGTPEDEAAVPLLDPQAAASPVSAVAAEMATAARLSLTGCSLRVAVGARPAGQGLNRRAAWCAPVCWRRMTPAQHPWARGYA
jgi:hypothetical protein